MFVMFKRESSRFMVEFGAAADGPDGLELYGVGSRRISDGFVLSDFTMADLVQSMNEAARRGECVAVLRSYRPGAPRE